MVAPTQAEPEAQERRRKEESERHERERLATLEKERIEHLLKEAENWRRAADLRAFVASVRAIGTSGNIGVTERLDKWVAWVLALADRLDPIRSGRIPNDSMEGAG